MNELFEYQINFSLEGDIDVLYLLVDKRIQYHYNKVNRHAVSIFMLAYLFEKNASEGQLELDKVFDEIREMQSEIKYERVKLKEPVCLGDVTVM